VCGGFSRAGGPPPQGPQGLGFGAGNGKFHIRGFLLHCWSILPIEISKKVARKIWGENHLLGAGPYGGWYPCPGPWREVQKKFQVPRN